jgi:hypothetical protein
MKGEAVVVSCLYPEYPRLPVHTIVSGDAFPVIIPLIQRTNASLGSDINRFH